jgi:hypothetical protein
MIQFKRIELATNPSRPSEKMDFKGKETFESSSVRSKRIIKILFIKIAVCFAT